MIDVTVILLNSGLASTAVGPVEVFFSAGTFWNHCVGEAPEKRFSVRAVSVDQEPVRCLSPLIFVPQKSIYDVEKTDLVFVQTGGFDVDAMLGNHAALVPWLVAQHDAGAAVAAVCTGVAFPAEAGLLDGLHATTHWASAAEYAGRFPKVIWQPEYIITEDANMFCGGGVNSATDLALYLVEKFCGHRVALNTAKALLVDMPRLYQSGYAVHPLSPPHSDAKISDAERYIEKNFAEPIRTEDLADQAGMSARTFLRRFKFATGKLPGDYVQEIRIAMARSYLEASRDSVQVISYKVGYSDVAFFRTLFKRRTGMTPSEYRARFGLRLH
jgi:transcriptional regulator GlxA family with amidase domain